MRHPARTDFMDKYVVKGGKKLRYGFTTGSCAAAAAKAAALMALKQELVTEISIDTPKGWRLNLQVLKGAVDRQYGKCAIAKDSGDDPDITNGTLIFAEVHLNDTGVVEIDGGVGVGRVTKKGLSVAVGEAAINPVPRKMIQEEVGCVLPEGTGAKVVISVPEGEVLAKKTFNPKLGILGGISIIGTSGIVEPMSEEALKESIALELSILKEQGIEQCVFAPGNYGRDFCIQNGIPTDHLVKVSNFAGFMIDKAVEYGMKEILWVGHIGKLIKLSAGIFHTHSRMADGRMEALAANLAYNGAGQKLIQNVMDSNTTEEAAAWIMASSHQDIFNILAEKISLKSRERSYDEIAFGTLLFSNDFGLLGMDDIARRYMEGKNA